MRIRSALWSGLVALAVLAMGGNPATAGSIFYKEAKLKEATSDTRCHGQALRDLELFSPRGAQVYQALSDRKGMFWPFLTCDNVALGLATAVHEGVHGLTEQLDGYPLIHGGVLKRPHEVEKFVAPRVISRRFSRDNIFVQNYLLPGAASSADTLMFLFDELNAYTHDLHTAVRIRSLPGGQTPVDHRDGLTSLMRFTMNYADEARANYPDTWRGLNSAKVRNVVNVLWSQAEMTLASACGIPRFGGEDHRYVAEMCDTRKSSALAEVLGRPVVCHRRCLNKPDDRDEPRFEVADASAALSRPRQAPARAMEVAPAPASPDMRVARRPTRWPVLAPPARTITLASLPADSPARFANPALLPPRLISAPVLIRNVQQ